jgi:hypothetical protein
MAAPTFQSSDPADTAVNVSVQQVVSLTFSAAILASSVTPATLQIFRSDDQVPLRGSITVSGTRIVFVPESVLAEDTLYRIKAFGSDAGTGSAIRSTTGEFLALTKELSFRTGQERFVSLTEIASRNDIESVGPIREGDPLAVQPTGGSLEVDETTPAAFTCGVPVDATGITIDFSQDLNAATVTPATVIVTQSPVLGIEDYYGILPSGQLEVMLATQLGQTLTPPVGTLLAQDDLVFYQLAAGDDFLYNTEVRVQVTTEVEGLDGATLEALFEFYFTTTYIPLYIGPQLLRIEMGPAVASLTDDTLCRIIHKNSIEAWELSGRSIPLTNPPYRIRKWVRCKSMLDILGVLLLARDLREGQTKTLGDLTIRQQPADPTLGAMYRQATACLAELGFYDQEGQLASVGVKGSASGTERLDFRMRTWDHLLLQAVPSANLMEERGEKQRLSIDYAFAGKDFHFTRQFFLSVANSSSVARSL